MVNFNIGKRKVGKGFDPLIIAEIGINHGGNLKVAKLMVDAASNVGVEVIKHQTHIIEDEMSSLAKKIKPGNSNLSIYEIMKSCALSFEEELSLKKYVESKNMIFLSTPFSRAAADRLEKMNVQAYKIGSGECNNFPLLKHISSFGKPIILSTGMNNIDSISKAVKIFEDYKIPFALLHTTNLYPTPYKLVRLGAMVELIKKFPNVVVGLSDHTINNLASFGAIALGAKIIERHFTDTMKRSGPDIVCSMDPTACRELIEGSKILSQELGGNKKPTEEEQVTMDFAFASIVTIKPIKKGETFTLDNIWVKRPGKNGIPAEKFEEILGKKAAKNLLNDYHLTLMDII